MEKCPYHCCGQRIPPQIRGLHLMYHRKSYHGDFTTCKYNPHHWIPTAEYPLHEGICPDRQLVEDVLKEQKAMIIARGQCQLAFKDQTTVNAVAKKALNAEVEVFMHDTKKHRTISGDSGIETEESPTVIPNTAMASSMKIHQCSVPYSAKLEEQWLLGEETLRFFEQLRALLQRTLAVLPNKLSGSGNKTEKFLLTSGQGPLGGTQTADNIKCIMTILGDNVIQAEVNIRYAKAAGHMYRGTAQPDVQWKLQQVEDLYNLVQKALTQVDFILGFLKSHQQSEVVSGRISVSLSRIMTALRQGRDTLVIPKKRTFGELRQSRTTRCFNPPLPSDLLVSVYVSSDKLVCAAYQITAPPPNQLSSSGGAALKLPPFTVSQAECRVAWLTLALQKLSAALNLCQQHSNKLKIFERYEL